MSRPRRAAWLRVLGLAVAAGLQCAPAQASLGGDVASVEHDRMRLQGQRRAVAQSSVHVQTHLLVLGDGSVIKEYLGPAGTVFAVSWSTRFKPRLDELLGTQADAYAQAAREAMRRPGIRHAVALERGDLVVHAHEHLTSHVGLAYLKSQLPPGVGVDALH